ncbi:STAS domain-containing protein [Oceanospirillum linum]|uniref:STAS domain-containing protein n=1 Tax=Oceanospirillum linum TaxID=966 RepID=A0A1T1H9H5_OCELI|nr:STAS domain-containing protein [Oceanospirillum linum]OOV86492.1 hypothetical protein BTA35_0213395 [Oceanospirillum linum]SEG34903.1 STAS domain-containing protein [Oleiphilus messinensis]SMP29612.1 ABC-type transporter Mla maintaining outer membrane lipid asymmetry, MlaB component, contains STAS domain [Oceanospirillum linum]
MKPCAEKNQRATIVTSPSGVLQVSGVLDFSTILPLRKQGELLIVEGPESIEVDFSGVHASGSAAVSLMMCWLRAACRADKAIHFTGVPDLLERIIAVSGLSGHLSFERPHRCCE